MSPARPIESDTLSGWQHSWGSLLVLGSRIDVCAQHEEHGMTDATAISPTTILTNKEAAEGPRWFHLTDNPKSPVRYRLQDILDWIEEQCKGW